MFDLDLSQLTPDAILSAGDTYCALRQRADARFLEAVSAYAHHFLELQTAPASLAGQTTADMAGAERLKVYGGDGCPGVAEFAVMELGCRFGLSPGIASDLVTEVLALQYRLPRTWARVLTGEAEAWRARKIARACMSLTLEAAAFVDARVEAVINALTPRRLMAAVKAAIMEADPALAKAAADIGARSRGVWIGQSDNNGTKTAAIRAATGDLIRFDAAIENIAETFRALGDTDSLDERRARALGWLADPEAVLRLRAEHQALLHTTTTPENHPNHATNTHSKRPRPSDASADQTTAHDDAGPYGEAGGGQGGMLAQRLAEVKERAREAERQRAAASGGRGKGKDGHHTLYVFASDAVLAAGEGVVRVEGIGPMLLSQVPELFGHDKFIVKPVIDLRQPISVDRYEIPERIRERVRLMNPISPFPWSNTETTPRTDLDHITPYKRGGPPGQTSTENLAPLSRPQHRLKTFGEWSYRHLPHGAYEWTTRNGSLYRVDHNGSRRILQRAPIQGTPSSTPGTNRSTP